MTMAIPPVILCTDLDGTLVDHEDPQHTALRTLTAALESQETPVKIVFNTGRSPVSVEDLAAKAPLPKPSILIASVGAEILHGGILDAAWSEKLSRSGFDARRIDAAIASRAGDAATPQAESEQRAFKRSFTVDNEGGANAIRRAIADEGLANSCQVIHSAGMYVDVLPALADKGAALQHVLQVIAEECGCTYADVAERCVACGDSANDATMLQCAAIKVCVVGNALPELLAGVDFANDNVFYDPSLRGAAAILAALKVFGLITLPV
eukprot:TRINITY_DN76486_c0_g1_i1.p1 TRINITY_DN76486_c0_g1~~TRINITY_DN76486_c0_g1_i1.p1  ORF type:complete len:267 (-),score=49.10 TRINITY_DN76486_c0_g1_i1:340-1140(-)